MDTGRESEWLGEADTSPSLAKTTVAPWKGITMLIARLATVIRTVASQQVARLAPVAVCALGLGACQNYTTAPMCHAGNDVSVPGLTGVYTLSTQADDFSTATVELKIGMGETGQLAMSSTDGSSSQAQVCNVDGETLIESYDDTVGAYQQMRFFVTGLGITELPLFFDKATLDAAGVTTKIIDVPDGMKRLIGAKLSGRLAAVLTRLAPLVKGTTPGLLVDNRGIPETVLLRHARTSPAGVSLLRR